MQFHQVSVLLSRLHIAERNPSVTPVILREMDKIKDADMDALPQFIIVITFFNLSGINLAHIKEHPVCPVLKVRDLHLHVHPSPIFQFHQHIKDPQLVIL